MLLEAQYLQFVMAAEHNKQVFVDRYLVTLQSRQFEVVVTQMLQPLSQPEQTPPTRIEDRLQLVQAVVEVEQLAQPPEQAEQAELALSK
jgi:hypothetical protein